ncbi:c-type cytochrome [Maribacter sp. 2307ULW6-5]|uniref:c-type cytochrome n=1 Tax=Maribacter sp. 2307ULW6-5 TaxID=3386275 RepID=UPI0039BD3407
MKGLPTFRCLGLALLFLPGIIRAQSDDLRASMHRGAEIYADFCMNCHMANGEGVPYTFPPLANSDYLMKNRTASIAGVKYGMQGEIVVNGETYNGTMAPMGLEDGEVADVMNYILNIWGNRSDKMVTPEEVAAVQKP